MTRKLVSERRIENLRFAGLKVSNFEVRLDDGRIVYSSWIDIAEDDRIVIDGRTQHEVEQLVDSTLHLALYCRLAAH